MAQINAERFLADLDALREIGRVSTGVRRRALSEEDMAARRWLAGRFEAAGLRPVWDPIGTLFGLAAEGDGPWLLVGSHSDTQLEGGWLDGALGVVCGLEAARAHAEAGLPPLAVVSFQDEESRFSGLLGSHVFVGATSLAEAEALTDLDGVRLGDLRARYPELAAAELVSPGRFNGFLEAHIEQGLELDARGETVAAVDRIVGYRQLHAAFIGEQNHAGTTRMARRRDAFRGLVELYGALDRAFAPLLEEATVWTIGRVEVAPNAPSIVPGAARFMVQWRDAEAPRLEAMESLLRREIAAVADRLGLSAEISETEALPPCALDPALVDCVRAAAEAIAPGRWRTLTSGAIHDAQVLARVMPAAMAFAPSIGGKSHCFEEDTKREDLVATARVISDAAARWTAGT